MKRCPHCQNPAITFSEWGSGLNAFRTRCRSCGTALKATKATYIAALITFAVVLAALFFIEPWAKSEGVRHYTFRHVIVGGLAMLVAAVSYRFCGYALNDKQ